MSYLRKYFRWILGAMLGALAGLLLWRFVGCSTGSCPITANPYLSMIWLGFIGVMLVPSPKKNDEEV